MLPISDEKIFQLQYKIAHNRDEQAYQQLFLQLHKPLIQFSVTITKSKEASEEIFSDVFMKIWNMGINLCEIEHLKIYLYKSMKNASLNYVAKAAKMPMVDIDSLPYDNLANEATPEQLVSFTEFKNIVSKAIAALPPKANLVFRLIKEENFSYKQVADILGISINTIEGHMTAALKKLSLSLNKFKS